MHYQTCNICSGKIPLIYQNLRQATATPVKALFCGLFIVNSLHHVSGIGMDDEDDDDPDAQADPTNQINLQVSSRFV